MFSKILAEIKTYKKSFINIKLFILSMIAAFGIGIGGYFLYRNNYLTILYSLICFIMIISLFLINNIKNFVKLSLTFFFLFLLNYLYEKDIFIYSLSQTYLFMDFIIFSWANNIAFIGIFYYLYKILSSQNIQWSLYFSSKKIYFFIAIISILTGYIFYIINPLSSLLPYKEIALFTLFLVIIMVYSLSKKICIWFCACSNLSFLLSFLFVILLTVSNGVSYNTLSIKKYFFNTNFSYLVTFQILTFMPLIFMIIPEKIYSKYTKPIGVLLVVILLTCGLLTRYYPIFTNYYKNFTHY